MRGYRWVMPVAAIAALSLFGCDKSGGSSTSGTSAESEEGEGAETKTKPKTKPESGSSTGDQDQDKKPELYDEPVERRLHTDRVEASSFLWTDWNRFQENYHPSYIADGDPKTAWVEGADNSGAGSWIRVHLSKVDGATAVRLRLRNGYHKSESLFKKNARAQKVRIETLPAKHVHEVTLKDEMDWQQVTFEQPSGPLEAIQLTVDSVYEGSKYTDLCISDIEIFVTGSTVENPAFEKAKLDQILDWKKQRIAMAEAFKSGKNKKLPIAASYRVETIDTSRIRTDSTPDLGFWLERAGGKVGARAALDRAKTAVASNFEGWKPVDHAIDDKRRIPQVDGLYHPYPDELASWWIREDAFMLPVIDDVSVLTGVGLSLFGAKRSFGPQGPKKCPANETYLWRPPEDDGPKMTQLLVLHCAVIEERDGQYVEPIRQLLGFDDEGRLILLVSSGGVETFDWNETGPDARIVGGKRLAVHGLASLESKRK